MRDVYYNIYLIYDLMDVRHSYFCSQFVSEKIGGAKGTELDDDFVEMERVSSFGAADEQRFYFW